MEFFSKNLHEIWVKFPEERNVFVLDTKHTNDQHGRRNITCKPAIIMSVSERCLSYCESTKRKNERQRPTLGVRYSEV